MGLFSELKSFDAYPKLHEDMQVRTLGGAAVSVVAGLFITILFFTELNLFLTTETVDHVYVDTNTHDILRINFNITFPHIPCNLLSLDAMDISGAQQININHHVFKRAINSDGAYISDEVLHELHETVQNETLQSDAIARIEEPGYCGSCYGAGNEGQCCNTCTSVQEAYQHKGWAMIDLDKIEQCVATGETKDVMMDELQRGDGCNINGYLEVAKVGGNFHFAPGKSYQHRGSHIHDLEAFGDYRFNFTHHIHHLSFGELFPGVVNPLDNTERVETELAITKKKKDADNVIVVESLQQLLEQLSGMTHKQPGGGMFSYYTQVVPTEYHALDGQHIKTNQYSVTEHYKTVSHSDGSGLPGVFMYYEISPMVVDVVEKRQSFPHFLTQLCAILGGVFTVAGMFDKLIHAGLRKMQQKIEIGKLS